MSLCINWRWKWEICKKKNVENELIAEPTHWHWQGGSLSMNQRHLLLKPFKKKTARIKCLGPHELDFPLLLSWMCGCIIQWAVLYLYTVQLSSSGCILHQHPLHFPHKHDKTPFSHAYTSCGGTVFPFDNLSHHRLLSLSSVTSPWCYNCHSSHPLFLSPVWRWF